MVTEPLFESVNEPPSASSGWGKWASAKAWMKEHPGSWIKIHMKHSSSAETFRARDFEVTCRANKDKGGVDVYVRWPK